jgi:hypothetical protein
MAFVLAFIVMAMGSTTMSFGPDPKEHFNFAPMHTHFGIDWDQLTVSRFW